MKSSLRSMERKRPTFRGGEKIAKSGIYRVFQCKQRGPHEVTLLRDEHFPRCAGCQDAVTFQLVRRVMLPEELECDGILASRDRKSTRLNSSHTVISYAVFCLKKKKVSSMPPQTIASKLMCTIV